MAMLKPMNRNAWLAALLQLLLIVCAALMAVWVALPWLAVGALGFAGLSAVVLQSAVRGMAPRLGAVAWRAGLVCSLLFWSALVILGAWDDYYSVMAFLMGGTFASAGAFAAEDPLKTRAKGLAMAWLFCGGLLWLGGGYALNKTATFYSGLAILLGLSVLCKRWFRLAVPGILVANSAIILLVGLPAADLLVRPHDRLDLQPETWAKFYNYSEARGNPAAFVKWRFFFIDQFNRMGGALFAPATNKAVPFRLKPNSRGFLFQSPIAINSRGFRGPEIPQVKGEAYRIVALGESTTFGMTMRPGDRPWPGWLEQIIHERLQSRRPVEVINAGVPAYSIINNVSRLISEILPLKPDLIISYHGYNGFTLINDALPPSLGPPPPVYRARPLKLLADVEQHFRTMAYERRARPRVPSHPAALANPMETEYARAYERLIKFARTNRIRLALANYSMSVNEQSDPAVIAFYRGAFGAAYQQMRANVAHSFIVRQLAMKHPEVCLVDTHPHLDGENDHFIDLVHLTESGREQLAENVFAGIRRVLEEDLAATPAPAGR